MSLNNFQLRYLWVLSAWLFFYSFPSKTSAQSSKKIPQITHYSRSDFKADAQFWTMTEDHEGVLYFGNNDGIIIFDGEQWQKVTLPNHSSVRSLITAKDGTIYAGGYNELGVVKRNSFGKYYYSSKSEELKLNREKTENLWQVHEFKGSIIFRSFNELTVITGKTATHIQSNNRFTRSDIVDGHFYVQDIDSGIFEFDPENLTLKEVVSSHENNEYIVSMLQASEKDMLLLVGRSGNIYKASKKNGEVELWKSIFRPNDSDLVVTAIQFKNEIMLGTLASGIVKLTQNGEIIRGSRSFSKLYDSTVLSIHTTKENNLWVLMNNGLDFVEYNSPVSLLFDSASIYDILIFNKEIFLATNKGVFYSPFDRPISQRTNFRFRKIPELEGQAWSLQEAEGQVVVGHDNGLFYLDDKIPVQIGNENGFWRILPTGNKNSPYIASSYSALYPLNYQNGLWTLGRKIKGFDESGRDILKGDGENTFWVCHGYKGVYKLKLTEDFSRVYALEHFTDKNGLRSPFNINATRWNGEVIFTTNTGIYTFNDSIHRFEPYQPLNIILDSTYNTRKLLQNENKAWFVQDDQVGYFDLHSEEKKLHKNLFLNLKGNLNRSMESIVPLNDQKVLVGATNGLFLYNIQVDSINNNPSTKITSIFHNSDKGQFLPLTSEEEILLPNQKGVTRFEFTAPGLSSASEKQYQYKLEGISNRWSDWQSIAYKEYTHLGPGTYTFRVRSRNLIGEEAQEAAYSFTIPPMWYQTRLAYLFYFIAFISGLFLLVHLINKKNERERYKEKMAAQKAEKLLQLEINQLKLKQDREIINKHKEQLQEDNIRQSKELANYTMLLAKKKEVFSETHKNLKEFKKTLKTQAAKQRLQEVLVKLNQHKIGEEYMNIFDINFEKVHKDFFQRLKELNPHLTKRELRLCAFVKMDLTNKEIAPLLNISVRGVETARYRVRKKLDVQDSTFASFLEDIFERVPA